MPLTIQSEQYRAFEDQRLRAYAAEVGSILAPILAQRATPPLEPVTAEFAYNQFERAQQHGLSRRDELMAWTLCAGIYGPDFDSKMPQVRGIIADENYDRSVLLTHLAVEGLWSPPPIP